MAHSFVRIPTGEPYPDPLPKTVQLPFAEEQGSKIFYFTKDFSETDPDWEEQLHRWMILNGYCYVEELHRFQPSQKPGPAEEHFLGSS